MLGRVTPLVRMSRASDNDGCHRSDFPQVISNMMSHRPQEAHREPCHWIMKAPEPGGNVYTSSTRPYNVSKNHPNFDTSRRGA